MADNTIANAIKFLKGEEKSLPAAKTEGQVYFAYKNVGTAEKPSYTGAIYIDTPIGGTQNRIKMTANADVADKAFNDSAGASIRDTYLSSLGYTDDGKQTILIKGSGNNQTRIALPIASTTKSGIVTTDAQSFGGTKTFTTINSTNLTVTGSSGFNYSSIGAGTADVARPVWFADSSGNGKPVINTNFTYNPTTQTLSVANLSGTADKANKDNAGYDIRSTYISDITVNGTTLTFTKGSGATSSITLQDNNNAVTQTAIKSSDYTNWRTVLWGASNSGVEGFTPTTVTDCVFTSDTLTFQPSSGTLKAKIFKGNLSGNASTATSANKAINDGANQNIANTYVKYKTIKFNAAADKVYLLEGNGAGSATAASGENISTAIIPAATDKAAGVITATTQTFSGNKTFNDNVYINQLITGKSIDKLDASKFIIIPKVHYNIIDNTHTTETYLGALLKWICQKYPNREGCTFIGQAIPNATGNVSIYIYDTSALKNGYPQYAVGFFYNLGGTISSFGTSDYVPYYREGLMTNDKYAGSASSGGSAISANKLNTDAGSATRPVYFSGGVPVQCNDTLANSISGNASTATKLQTARTITLAGSVTGSAVFDGSNNITITTSTNHSHSQYLPLSGGAMTGPISYRGSKATNQMITFYDNPSDTSGNGIGIGGGGLTIIGGGEATSTVKTSIPNGGNEQMIIANDDIIEFYTHCQDGLGNATRTFIDNSGVFSGTAAKAATLTTSAGSSTQPIYFSGGKPVACAYTLSKSVPADAKFTDTWRPLGTTGDTACAGNDSRLSNARPASDVYSWAKASSKPSYSWGEITGKPSTFTPSSHEHTYLVGSYTGNGGQQNPNYFGLNKVGFLMMNTTVNGNSSYKDWLIMDCYGGNDVGGGVAFGVNRQRLGAYIMRSDASRKAWAEGAELLHTANYTEYTVTKSGSGASGTWGINISGSAGSVAWGNISGKPSSFNPSSHTHPYLPLAGGTMTGTINFTSNKLACMFGGSNSSHYSGIMHQTYGTESLVFATANAATSFIFKCGQNPTSMTSNTWNNIIPSMMIKNQSVYVNCSVVNGFTPAYNFLVNGSTRCDGTLGVTAEIDFFLNHSIPDPNSQILGARIKAYNDRLEFVFS